jgi:hypothetical protein
MTDLHPTARSLIDRAKRREAALPEEVRGRVRSSVLRRAAAFGAAVSTTATASVAAKAGAVLASLATPLVASVTAVGLIGGGILVVASVASGPAVPRHQAPRPGPTEPMSPSSQAPHAPFALETAVPSAPFRPLAAPPVAPRKKAPPTTTAPASPPTTQSPLVSPATTASVSAPAPSAVDPVPKLQPHPADTTLANQLGRLHRVREALRIRQPDRALALLGYDGSGPFEEEFEASRVSALCQLGREAEARSAVDRFVVRWPGSPLAGRLQGGCAALGRSDR